MKLFSQMSEEELRLEIDRLQMEETRARRFGMTSEAEVLRQRRALARSYLTDASRIQSGVVYEVEDHPDRFHVEKINGVMAWGKWEGGRETVAIPISLIRLPEEDNR
ncbi:DUF1811 family protein [Polycladomyces subterraneus]|uniref:YfhH family protein n=1 Tax=Polycladomyces subterraneus TaxID=1016997 RepID=A0ABT8IP22_9BACL|nr:DUF1811 family protein [Polycladomyces subterraneus]MDN4594286.1 YfhH family protein [Polycladomyces subterraneus]